jgi:CheY-like chemotaxis protein
MVEPGRSCQAVEPVDHVELRVLVVDDDAYVARAVGRMLAAHCVEIENDGSVAVERIRRGDAFDLVICDWHMAECDGQDVLTAIRDHGATGGRQPLVIVTSGNDELLQDKALDGVSLLIKPFGRAALRGLIRFMIAGRDQRGRVDDGAGDC